MIGGLLIDVHISKELNYLLSGVDFIIQILVPGYEKKKNLKAVKSCCDSHLPYKQTFFFDRGLGRGDECNPCQSKKKKKKFVKDVNKLKIWLVCVCVCVVCLYFPCTVLSKIFLDFDK